MESISAAVEAFTGAARSASVTAAEAERSFHQMGKAFDAVFNGKPRKHPLVLAVERATEGNNKSKRRT